jgi:serine/threonine-protein kinase
MEAPPVKDILLKKKFITEEKIALVEKRIEENLAYSVPGYNVISKIGEGATGVVYKAHQPLMERMVALRFLKEEFAGDRAAVKSFLTQARAMAKFHHKNIIAGYDASEYQGKYYVAMEYVDGPSVKDILEVELTMDESETFRIILQVAEALEHAAEYGIVHRDIKPENILVDRKGIPKLSDFSLAKELGRDAAVPEAGQAVGTPFYISPEQAKGFADVDFRSDVYSLGVTVFHMLTGRVPYGGDDPTEIMTKHIMEDVPDILDISPELSKETAAIVTRMMAKDSGDRYQTPGELIAEVRRVLGTLDEKPSEEPAEEEAASDEPAEDEPEDEPEGEVLYATPGAKPKRKSRRLGRRKRRLRRARVQYAQPQAKPMDVTNVPVAMPVPPAVRSADEPSVVTARPAPKPRPPSGRQRPSSGRQASSSGRQAPPRRPKSGRQEAPMAMPISGKDIEEPPVAKPAAKSASDSARHFVEKMSRTPKRSVEDEVEYVQTPNSAMVLIVIGVVALVVIAAVVFGTLATRGTPKPASTKKDSNANYSASRDKEKGREDAAKEPATRTGDTGAGGEAPDTLVSDAGVVAQDTAAELADAKKHRAEHPEDVKGYVQKLRDLIKNARTVPDREKVEKILDNFAEIRFTEAKRASREQIRKKEYNRALSVLDDFMDTFSGHKLVSEAGLIYQETLGKFRKRYDAVRQSARELADNGRYEEARRLYKTVLEWKIEEFTARVNEDVEAVDAMERRETAEANQGVEDRFYDFSADVRALLREFDPEGAVSLIESHMASEKSGIFKEQAKELLAEVKDIQSVFNAARRYVRNRVNAKLNFWDREVKKNIIGHVTSFRDDIIVLESDRRPPETLKIRLQDVRAEDFIQWASDSLNRNKARTQRLFGMCYLFLYGKKDKANGRFAKAQDLGDTTVDKYVDVMDRLTFDTLYQNAQIALGKKEYLKALELFSELLDDYGNSPFMGTKADIIRQKKKSILKESGILNLFHGAVPIKFDKGVIEVVYDFERMAQATDFTTVSKTKGAWTLKDKALHGEGSVLCQWRGVFENEASIEMDLTFHSDDPTMLIVINSDGIGRKGRGYIVGLGVQGEGGRRINSIAHFRRGKPRKLQGCEEPVFAKGRSYRIKITYADKYIRVFVDGKNIANAKDDDFTWGGILLQVVNTEVSIHNATIRGRMQPRWFKRVTRKRR